MDIETAINLAKAVKDSPHIDHQAFYALAREVEQLRDRSLRNQAALPTGNCYEARHHETDWYCCLDNEGEHCGSARQLWQENAKLRAHVDYWRNVVRATRGSSEYRKLCEMAQEALREAEVNDETT